MSRKSRLATLFVIAAVGLGIFFLFRGAPAERSITYDLGDAHENVVRLEVFIRLDGDLVRHVRWFFRPGKAPRRISHRPILPAEEMTVLIEIEGSLGEIHEERRELDGRQTGDVTFHLQGR